MPNPAREAFLIEKQSLRSQLREARRNHVAAQPGSIRALLFKQPPAPLLGMISGTAVVGLYRACRDEAPAASYARHFYEAGHSIALPRIAPSTHEMAFHAHSDPFGESDLEGGPFGLLQPLASAEVLVPDIIFVPLVGFTANGHRLGQGGGYYDRWLAKHPAALAIGLAWDAQLVEDLPQEAHDMPLHAVITPTRFYGPFNA